MSNQNGHKERLRQRYLQRGYGALLDYEVIELLLSYSILRKDTKDLAKSLIKEFGGLEEVLKADPKKLKEIPGMGERSIVFLGLVADLAEQLFRDRLQKEEGIHIRRKRDLISYIRSEIGFEAREKFVVLYLDAANRLKHSEEIFQGTIDRSAVYPREILERVLKYQAKSVIFAHNHPSGKVDASKKDIELTMEMRDSLKMFDVLLLEHIIVSPDSYFSFLEEGLL